MAPADAVRDPAERSALFERAFELRARREWGPLSELLRSLAADRLAREPELGLALALAEYHQGRLDEARRVLHDVGEATSLRWNDRLARLRVGLEGSIAFRTGRIRDAEERFLAQLELASGAGDHKLVAAACVNLGNVAGLRGSYAEALASYGRGLASAQRVGDRFTLAAAHGNAAIAYRELGMYHAAEGHLREALAYAPDQETLALAEKIRAEVLADMGELRLAEAIARRALARFGPGGDPDYEGDVLRVLGVIAARSGRRPKARRHLEAALERALRSGGPQLAAETREELAVLAMAAGDRERAAQLAGAAERFYQEIGADARAQRLRTRLRDAAAAGAPATAE